MAAPTDTLLLALFQAQLLDPGQLASIQTWANEKNADPATAGRELAARGWVTLFQINEVYRGRARDLNVGPYLLLELLGEGGMGRVFKARHTRLGRDVALKVIRKDKLSNPMSVSRFQQEIHAAAQLSHPNVVMAFDAETAGENVFLSMEYVEGTDLTKLVRQNGPMPIPHACEAIRQAALGLQHAHERGLVHRDIKPSNLLYTPRGQVKLLDLGLAMLNQARVPGGENANRVTQDGFVLGTPDFLAPEQAQNPAGVDIRADIYGLGATLYYLLTASVPFEGTSPTDKMLKHITEPPPLLRHKRFDAPPQLEAIIQWMMAKRPEDRPQTPAQVALALAQFGLQPAAFAPQPLAEAPVAEPVVPNHFAGFDSSHDSSIEEPQTEARPRRRRSETRVNEPKKRSALPLIIIGLAVAFVFCAGTIVVGIALIQRAIENAKPLATEVTAPGNIKLVKIEPGSFQMGSPDAEGGHQPDEGPIRTIKLTQPFYMATTELTREQYTAAMNKSPGKPPSGLSDKYLPRAPATLSWNDANEFIDALNKLDTNRRNGWDYRMPTEAEWEYCARAGKSEPFGAKSKVVQFTDGIFKLSEDDSYGELNSNPQLALYNFEKNPCPIGATEKDSDWVNRREPNEFGLFDLVGNVWEWTRDYYENYPPGDATDPLGPAKGLLRVARGGAYDCKPSECRAASRKMLDPNKAYPNVGLRIVLAPRLK